MRYNDYLHDDCAYSGDCPNSGGLFQMLLDIMSFLGVDRPFDVVDYALMPVGVVVWIALLVLFFCVGAALCYGAGILFMIVFTQALGLISLPFSLVGSAVRWAFGKRE